MKNQTKSNKAMGDKEIQLVKEFKNILERLPLDFANALLSHLIIIAQPETDKRKSDPYNLIQVKTEENVFDDNSWRIDLFVKWHTDKFTAILFEFKKGDESASQLERYYQEYTKNHKNSTPLIVSVCKNIPKKERSKIDSIISLTWEEFTKGISKILGVDSLHRLEFDKYEENDSRFSPEFPKRKLGESLEGLLEDFLWKIKNEKLIGSHKNRVVVVTGEKATKSTKEANLTWFGKNWDGSFEYIVVVFRKKLQYVGKVVKIYQPADYEVSQTDVAIDHEKVKLINKTLKELGLNRDEEIDFRDSPVAEMTEILLPQKEWGDLNYGSEYKHGAFTYSHRYFDSPSDFISHFISK